MSIMSTGTGVFATVLFLFLEPTNTTSSKAKFSSSRVIVNGFAFVTSCSTVLKPKEDITRVVGNDVTSRENVPSSPVVVPFVDFFSCTLMNASASPEESTTFPLIV